MSAPTKFGGGPAEFPHWDIFCSSARLGLVQYMGKDPLCLSLSKNIIITEATLTTSQTIPYAENFLTKN